MNARMMVAAVMLMPGLALANGPGATARPAKITGHIEVPRGQLLRNGRCLPRRHTSPEQWDTPVDETPDWDQREATDAASKDQPLACP